MKIDINNYEYLMFVDASGDDGSKFGKGSSICYAVGGYLVRKDDLSEDLKTLCDIRRIVSGDPDRELKYSTLRRHKNRAPAMEMFSSLHGRAVGRVSFKKVLVSTGSFDTEGKAFSVVSHAVAISLLNHCKEAAGKRVLIVVDRMKNTEERPVEMIANTAMQKDMQHLDSYDLIFRDSKDVDFQLIQIADFIAGILREHFEQYEENSLMRGFTQKCPICARVITQKLCGHSGAKGRASLTASTNYRYLRPLFHIQNNLEMMDYLYLDPPYLLEKFFFIYCPKI